MTAKDRDLVCRIAGDIAGHVYGIWESEGYADYTDDNCASAAVDLAMAIVEQVDKRISEEEKAV